MNQVYIHNRRIWDERARQRLPHTETAARGDVNDPLTAADPLGWIERPVTGGAMEFLHTWEDLIGGMCRSDFIIEDLFEPRHSDHRASYLPPFVTIKARRRRKLILTTDEHG